MSKLYLSPNSFSREFFQTSAQFILRTQAEDGSIPWFSGACVDPWNHVEAAMSLSIGGEHAAAERAYCWLFERQLSDGSWWAAYMDGQSVGQPRRESNFIAYIATGVWHHYLITQSATFLTAMWPMIEKAIGFVLGLQTEHGDILWAMGEGDCVEDDALRTGCSSIYKSLECAINIAYVLERDTHIASWLVARKRLRHALLHKPERFDRTWESKARYSMDWFYPVLTGVIPKERALKHLNARWSEFVEEGMGCRCVADEPWITVAESCELVIALLVAGDRIRAQKLFSWVHQWRLDDGSYWTGYQFIQDVLWPDEKPTWTTGAVLLAADALMKYSQAANLFLGVNLVCVEDEVGQQGVGNF